jgi:hypothetical protein
MEQRFIILTLTKTRMERLSLLLMIIREKSGLTHLPRFIEQTTTPMSQTKYFHRTNSTAISF